MQLVMFGLRQDCALATGDSLRQKHGGCFAFRSSSWKLKQVQCSCEGTRSSFSASSCLDQPELWWGVCQGGMPHPGKALWLWPACLGCTRACQPVELCKGFWLVQILSQEEISLLWPDHFNLQTNPSPAPGVCRKFTYSVCETAFAPWDTVTMAQGEKLKFM